jgi:hypothetical protein
MDISQPASMPAIRGGLRHWILPQAKSIYPPAADSNGNSAIRGAALRAQSGILAVFRLGSFALQNSGKFSG